MNGIDTRLLGDAQDGFNIEVSSERTTGRAQLVTFIRLEAMQRKAIFLSVHGDRADSELRRCAHDANRDLATVGDKQLFDFFRHRSMHRTPGTRRVWYMKACLLDLGGHTEPAAAASGPLRYY